MSDAHADPLVQVERISLPVRAQRTLDGELDAFAAGMFACVLANVDDDDESPEALELADAILDTFDTPDYSIYMPERNVVESQSWEGPQHCCLDKLLPQALTIILHDLTQRRIELYV